MQPSHPPTPSQPSVTLAAAPTTLTTAPPLQPDSPAIEAAAHNAACLFAASHAACTRGDELCADELWDEAMVYFEEATAHTHTIRDPGWRSRVEAVLAELPFPKSAAPPQSLV